MGSTPHPEAAVAALHHGDLHRRDRPAGCRCVPPPDWPEAERWKAVEADLEEQFADLVFALGGSFVQRRELPQVGHVDGGAVSDQQLRHLVVAVGAGVVEGHQPAAQRDTPLLRCPALYPDEPARARPTLCPWRAHRPRGAAGTPPPTLGCNQQRSEAEWSVAPPGPGSSHSEPCTASEDRNRRMRTVPEEQGNTEDPGNLKGNSRNAEVIKER